MRTKEQLQQELLKSLQGSNPLFWLDPDGETSTLISPLDDQEKGKVESDDFDTDTILLVKRLDGDGEIEVLSSELYPTSLEHIVIGIPIEFDEDKPDVLLDIEEAIGEGDMQTAFNLCYDHYDGDEYDWYELDDYFERLNQSAIDTENLYWYNCEVYVPDA